MNPHPPQFSRRSHFTAKLSRATWRIALAAVVVLAFGLISAFAWKQEKGLYEASGLARCRTQPGKYWSHADSFNPAELHLLDENGAIQISYPIAGVKNIDWEDIASDGLGFLYIGDIGNNNGKRKNLVVHRLREPDLKAVPKPTKLRVDRSLYFRYPDRASATSRSSDFNAESLFWAKGHLYLLTKHSKDTKTVLYRFPDFSRHQAENQRRQSRRSRVTLERIGEFNLGGSDRIAFGGQATSADVSPDGRYLALLSYHALFIFDLAFDPYNPLARPLRRFDLSMWTTQQCEGVAWSSANRGKDSASQPKILIINEAGAVFKLNNPLSTREPSRLFHKVYDYPQSLSSPSE